MEYFLWHLTDMHGFMPRYRCGNWTPGLMLLHITGDFLVFLSYLIIPFLLLYLRGLWKRDRLSMERMEAFLPLLSTLFALFIVACGSTHLNQVLVFWFPMYRLFGIFTLITGMVSVATAAALFYVIRVSTRPRRSGQETG